MKIIPITSITISENRQRREFSLEKLIELSESIQHGAAGLQNPIVVRQEGEIIILVSGERRLRAITDIYELGGRFSYAGELVPEGHVPVNLLGELSELEAQEAELDENIRRTDLTWQEHAAATARLEALRSAQAAAAGLPAPTAADIALETRGDDLDLKWSKQVVNRELLVASHLGNENVRNAKSLDEAVKILKKEERVARQQEIATAVGKTYNASQHTLVLEESEDFMKAAAPEQFSVILVDPPYGMGADTFGDSGGKAEGAHGYKDSEDVLVDIMGWFPNESFRLAAKQAHLYCFCDIEWFGHIKSWMEMAGWKVFRTPLIWFKPSAYRAPWPEQGPQRKYETILYAVKGDKRVNYLAGDVLTFPADENIGHAAQKPVPLFAELLRRSSTPGDKVADFFCGSGTIFPAATEVQCYATGVEHDPIAYGVALSRLQGE